MSLEDAFLQDIAARPGEDAPRLIFADWLEECGDADRAEFIRLQVERAQLVGEPTREARRRGKQLRHRERQLLAKHRRTWLGPLLGNIESYAFHRGLLHHVRLTPEQLLRHGGNLARFPAVQSVHLHWDGWGAVSLPELLGCLHLVWVT